MSGPARTAHVAAAAAWTHAADLSRACARADHYRRVGQTAADAWQVAVETARLADRAAAAATRAACALLPCPDAAARAAAMDASGAARAHLRVANA